MSSVVASKHSSAVGDVIDVATPASWKAIALGLMWLMEGVLATFAGVLLLCSPWLTPGDFLDFWIIGILPLLFGLGCLGMAIHRFRAAFQLDRYFRAGPGGVMIRAPAPGGLSVLLLGLGYRVHEHHLRWDEVKTWYPYLSTINGISSGSDIVIEPISGGRITIPTYLFSESRATIAANITRAMAR